MDTEPRYENLGGRQQLVVETAAELARIHELDPARWAATSAPAADLHLDDALERFLVDPKLGRLRVSHLLQARDWLLARLANRAGIDARSDVLVLDHLAAGDATGPLREEATRVLEELGLEDPTRLGLKDLRRYRKRFDNTLANGDGVVLPAEIPDEEVASFAETVLATVGGTPDSSGTEGVGYDEVHRFVEGARRYLAWTGRPEAIPSILPLQDATAAAFQALEAIRPKVDEWFLGCALLEQEGPVAGTVRLTEEEARALRKEGPRAIRDYLEHSLLAPLDATSTLPLDAVVHPAFREAFAALKEKVLQPLLGDDLAALDRDAWREAKKALEPFGHWQHARPPEPFEDVAPEELEETRVQELSARLRTFVDQDAAASTRLATLDDLEKLILLQRDILVLTRNTVSFAALYDPKRPALFQLGTLILDGRRLELTIRVRDRAAHRKIAEEARIFLVYAAILKSDKEVAFEVAAPVTSGERGRLTVGKHGIFLDRDGKEWDARIVDLVENPISLAEAVRAPFQRFARFVRERVQSIASTGLASAEKQLTEAAPPADAAAGAPAAPAPAAPCDDAPAAGRSSLQSMAVTISLATAALGSAAAFIVKALAETDPLRLVGSLLGIAFLIAFTSGFLGWLRLRRRDLAPLLEANGWAVNVPMALSRSLGKLFTRTPPLPGDADREGRGRIVVYLLLIALVLGAWNELRSRLRRWTSPPGAPAPAAAPLRP